MTLQKAYKCIDFVYHFERNGYAKSDNGEFKPFIGNNFNVDKIDITNKVGSSSMYNQVIFFNVNWLKLDNIININYLNFNLVGFEELKLQLLAKWIYEIYIAYKMNGYLLYVFDSNFEVYNSLLKNNYRGVFPSSMKPYKEYDLVHLNDNGRHYIKIN